MSSRSQKSVFVVIDCIERQIEEWEEENKWFVQTHAFNFILANLEKRILTVIGNPGLGKSMILHQTALFLRDTKGYSIFPCHRPSDIVSQFKKDTKQVFILDDVCGQFTLVQTYLHMWIQYEVGFQKVLESENSVILSSCRSQVFREIQCRCLTIFSGIVCDLNTGDFAINTQQKLKIADQYLSQKAMSEIKQHLDDFHMFPLLCRLYKDRESATAMSFFHDPFKFYKEELDRFQTEDHDDGRIRCCSLFLCVIHSGFLNQAILMEQFESDFSQTFKSSFVLFSLNQNVSPKQILDSLDTLLNTYLKKINGEYWVLHGRLFDFLCYYFGQHYQQFIINNADSNIIRDRIFLKSLKTSSPEFTIIIDKKNENEYFERLYRDMSSGYIENVLYNHQMIYQDFRAKFLSHLKELDVSCDFVFNENKKTPQLLPVNFACKFEYPELFEFFLSKTKDLNACEGSSVPLIMACRKGDKYMTGLLLDRGADVNKTDSFGCSPLLWSCVKGNLDIIQMVLNKNADVDNTEIRTKSSPLIWTLVGELFYLLDSSGIQGKELISNDGKTMAWIIEENIDQQFCTEEDLINGILSILQLGDVQGCHDALKQIENRTSPGFVSEMKKGNLPSLENKLKSDVSHTNNFIEIMNLFLERGIDIDKSSIGGVTALSFGCLLNMHQSIIYLLSKGANVNICDIAGTYPLHIAIRMRREDLVKLLIGQGANIHSLIEGYSQIKTAISNQNISIVNSLINAGADINQRDENGDTLLHFAIRYNNADLVSTLIKAGIPVDCKNNKGKTPLLLAVPFGFANVVAVLIKEGANADTHDFEGSSILFIASGEGHVDIVTMLLSAKRQFEMLEIELSVLEACKQNRKEVVNLLLLKRCHINILGKCLLEASERGFESIVSLLLEKRVQVNILNKDNDTPLALASLKGHTAIVRLLVAEKADMFVLNKNGESSPILACLYNRLEVLEVLIDNGCSVDSIEMKTKQTCLSVASSKGFGEIVAYLIAHGANVNAQSNIGTTPLMLAASKGYLNIVQTLIQHAADVNIQSQKGFTCLSLASSKGFHKIVTYLINHRASIDTANKTGDTPLMLASKKCHASTVKILLGNGAKVDIKNKEGLSALDLVRKNKHSEIEEILCKFLQSTDD